MFKSNLPKIPSFGKRRVPFLKIIFYKSDLHKRKSSAAAWESLTKTEATMAWGRWCSHGRRPVPISTLDHIFFAQPKFGTAAHEISNDTLILGKTYTVWFLPKTYLMFSPYPTCTYCVALTLSEFRLANMNSANEWIANMFLMLCPFPC